MDKKQPIKNMKKKHEDKQQKKAHLVDVVQNP